MSTRIGEILQRRGVIDSGQLDLALVIQDFYEDKLGQVLVDMKLAEPGQIEAGLMEQAHLHSS